MTDRRHGLSSPDSTACGVAGRRLELAGGEAIARGDRLYRIAADPDAIDCRRCLANLAEHGLALAWANVPPHPASIAKERRRLRRRRAAL
jgi:hypothetical protein